MEGTSNGTRDALAFEPIAIIGMSSKYAGDATNNEKLWQMLVEGRSGWKPFPSSRFRSEGIYHPNNERLNSVSTQCITHVRKEKKRKEKVFGDTYLHATARPMLRAHISWKRMSDCLMRLSSATRVKLRR